MKRAILKFLCATGAFAPFRIANRGKALILTYHRFSHNGDGQTVSAREFEEHVQYLTTHYRLAPLSLLAKQLRTGQSIAPDTAVITIDDGYRDAYDIALPILRRYKAPATLFIVTDFVDRRAWLWTDKLRFLAVQTRVSKLEARINNQTFQAELNGLDSRMRTAACINAALKKLPDQEKEDALLEIEASLGVNVPELPPDDYAAISWDQMRRMEADGVEIGSHTKTHPILTSVSDSRLLSELTESRTRLEAMLGHEIDLLSYPNGNYDGRVQRAAAASGYSCAVTVELGFNDQSIDPMRLRRMDTEADFMRFIQITSGFDQIKNRFRHTHRKAG